MLSHDEYARYDAVGLRELIASGQVSAAEVEAVALEAMSWADERVNGLTQSFDSPLHYDPEGPFAGVPFLLKDYGPVAEGVPFTIGSRALQGVTADHDSDMMKRYRAAGLATMGVTTAPEMAISFATESVRYGITRNPWDLERGVGGSSGGAAAMVAAGAVPVAQASDGAGSLRIPASCCGLVGLKPSRGRIPCGPDVGEPAFGMSYEFVLTRTVRDTAHFLDLLHGPGVGDKYTAPPPSRSYVDELTADLGPLRVGVCTSAWSGAAVDPEVAAHAVQAGKLLDHLGCVVTEASPAIDWEDAFAGLKAELTAIAEPWLMAPRQPGPGQVEAVSAKVLAEIRELSAMGLMAQLAAQNRTSRAVGAFFTDYDILLTPTLGQVPAPHGTFDFDSDEYTVDSWLTRIFSYGPFAMVFNVTGQPAISLPLGQSTGGLPIGVQFVAAYGREDLLLRLAARLAEAQPWQERIPPVYVP
jgi:amidase